MLRDSRVLTVTIPASGSLSDAFDMGPFAGGYLVMPAAWTSASIAFKVAPEAGGTYVALYKESALVELGGSTVSVAGGLPADLAGCRYVKLFSETAGSDVNQGAARTFTVVLKS